MASPKFAPGSAHLLQVTRHGLYCPAGDFYIDPWRPVDRAVITHAHADHARWGNKHYLAAHESRTVLRQRLGSEVSLETLQWGETRNLNGVQVSLHPAGHILGSAQVRVEYRGEIWVVSGDYKTEADPTCRPWEPVRCHCFITESTFGLPVYRWQPQETVMDEINQWWAANQAAGRTSVLFGYALGKSQRLLAGVDASQGPVVVHGAVEHLVRAYREADIQLPETHYYAEDVKQLDLDRALVLAPPSAAGTPWMRKFGPASTAFASGWMQVRGNRRRRNADRGFVLSDHVDWPSLLQAISLTQAERVLVTHGYVDTVVRYLNECGWRAAPLQTPYGQEEETPEPPADPPVSAEPASQDPQAGQTDSK